jgi:glycosyltransferase involved in cell wall biosynthesis
MRTCSHGDRRPDLTCMPDGSMQSGLVNDGGLRVAVVCHSHPSISKGGAEVAAHSLFRGLRQIGVDAIFICACSHEQRGRLAFSDPNEFAVYHEAERYEHFYHLAPAAVESQLLRILRERRINVVNFHHFLNLGLNSLRAARALPNVRCYFTIHEFLAICHNHGQMVTRPAHLLCSKATTEACVNCFPELLRSQFAVRRESLLDAFGGFDGFISPSRFLAQRFVSWGLDSERMAVIENGLAGSIQQPQRASTESTWTFGYFGQINPFKGVDVVLAAAELLAQDPDLANSIRLRIHGNFVGQPQAFIDRFDGILKAHPFVSYAGPYNSSSVYRLMGECDYIVVPSRWWENSPVVIQEAYAVGTPVICTGIGGLAEKVQDGISGLHFKLGDAADLLRAIRTAASLEMAHKLRAGVPAVSTAQDMAQHYLKLFQPARQSPAVEPVLEDVGG